METISIHEAKSLFALFAFLVVFTCAISLTARFAQEREGREID